MNVSSETKRKFEFSTEPETATKIQRILTREFNYEIEARETELNLVEERIIQVATLLQQVKGSLFNSLDGEPKKWTKSLDIDGRKVRVRVGAEKLFARLPDGSFIQFICPTCKRDRFSNKLGFVNHCRILHKLKFASYEDASLHCGVLVDESVVPMDDPSRQEQPLTQFQLQRFQQMHDLSLNEHYNSPHVQAWLALNSRIPSLAEAISFRPSSLSTVSTPSFSAATHFGDDPPSVSEMPTPGGKSVPSRSNTEDDLSSSTSSMLSSSSLSFSSLSLSSSLPSIRSSTQFISARRDTNNNQEPSSRFYIKKRIIVGNTSKAIPPDRREQDDMATHKWMVYVRGPAEEPSISHFVSKVWFYLHSSYHPNTVVEVQNRYQPPFHLTRWGWGEFPVRVRLFFVDPKNKPIDIIHSLKLDTALSGLQTLGGETPVEIELDRFFFEEKSRRSSISSVSPSRLSSDGNDKSTNGMFDINDDELEQLAVVMPEQGSNYAADWIHQTLSLSQMMKIKNEPSEEDFQLYIQTDKKIDSPPATTMPTTNSLNSANATNPINSTNTTVATNNNNRATSPPALPTNGEELFLLPRAQQQLPILPETTLPLSSQLVNTCLRLGVLTYPLVTDNTSITRLLTYACAPSKEVFLQWNLGKQKASEWQRARQLRRFLVDKVKADFTTKTLVYWCREKGHTPLTKEQEAAKAQESSLSDTPSHSGDQPGCELQDNYYYCKYCGSIHYPSPATTFEGLQRQCAVSSLSLPLRSHTPLSDLFPSFKLPILPKQEMVDSGYFGATQTSAPFLLNLPISNTIPHSLNPSLDAHEMGWVHQLLISSVFGDDNKLSKSNKLTNNESNSLDQPPEPLIQKATLLFAKRLIQDTNLVVAKQREKESSDGMKVMVPIHVYNAIKQNPLFDFLTNFGLGGEKNVP